MGPNSWIVKHRRGISLYVGVWVVLGVAGDGCRAIQAPAWDDPSFEDLAFADITIDIKH